MKNGIVKTRTTIIHKNEEIPIDLYRERRGSVRVAFGKKSIILRLPVHLNLKTQQSEYSKAKNWISRKLDEHPEYIEQYKIRTGDRSIVVMNRSYDIRVIHEERKTGGASIKGNTIYIKLPNQIDKRSASVTIKKILSRLMSSLYIDVVKKEVRELNAMHFNKEIKSIRLKYNKSNWGSCSSKKNINLSSRLLLVPKEVRQYVIIHELAHLIEMNHSANFWNIVAGACPEYKQHEKWLTKNGPGIDF